MVPQQETREDDDRNHGPPKRAAFNNNTTKGTTTTSGTQLPPVQGEIINHHSEAGTSHVKQYRASVAKKVNARTMPYPSTSSLNSISSQLSSLNLGPASIFGDDDSSDQSFFFRGGAGANSADDNINLQAQHFSLLNQVYNWLQNERAKLSDTAATATTSTSTASEEKGHEYDPNAAAMGEASTKGEQSTGGPEAGLALDRLERILMQYSIAGGKEIASGTSSSRRKGSGTAKRQSALKGLRRGSASDSDNADADLPPPGADVVLDNSKTLLYSGGEADSDIGVSTNNSNKAPAKDREYWFHFKSEIVRLTHTLGFKGWRRVPLDSGGEVEVVRLSGALTNAVYVVTPPKTLFNTTRSNDSSGSTIPKKPPPKLLLRIYGPQVEHLIDRENELQILRRLAKKNIGPRVLGTFKNGRFEEYLEARTLTCRDLRIPDTSIQIAKRMRELHDGIELLREERESGPTLWKNWDKWVNRCERVITWLDGEILSENSMSKADSQPWRKRGFVCGVPWSTFRMMVDRYRKWLDASCGGADEVRRRLVFAHNDTQYGNLLRLHPAGESPLLLPANEHKQLVVIDFEYASANLRGVEFSNHFTEWCYNYHDETRPWGCNPKWYPKVEEQKRFIRAYLTHRPRLHHSTDPQYQSGQYVSKSGVSSTMTTPALRPTATHSTGSRVPPFALDNYTPGAPTAIMEDEQYDEEVESEVEQLFRETRLWRIANSAQWVAWGIVQAKVPEMEAAFKQSENEHAKAKATAHAHANGNTDTNTNGNEHVSEHESESNSEEDSTLILTPTQDSLDSMSATDQVIQEVEVDEAADEFDYLAYAQDRALFFWADVLSMGLIKEEELPTEMVGHIKSRMIDC